MRNIMLDIIFLARVSLNNTGRWNTDIDKLDTTDQLISIIQPIPMIHGFNKKLIKTLIADASLLFMDFDNVRVSAQTIDISIQYAPIDTNV